MLLAVNLTPRRREPIIHGYPINQQVIRFCLSNFENSKTAGLAATEKLMKEGIHPNYREVLFMDMSNGFKFICRSTAPSRETGEYEGKESGHHEPRKSAHAKAAQFNWLPFVFPDIIKTWSSPQPTTPDCRAGYCGA